jgi:hypothetical protein
MVENNIFRNGLDNLTESSNLFPTMKTTFVDRKPTTLHKYVVDFRNKTYKVDYFTDRSSGECVKVDIMDDWGVSLYEIEDDDVLSEIFNAVKYEVDNLGE